jgi:hypothetical protein
MKPTLLAFAAGSVALALTACSSTGSNAPDEFRVVTLSPLTVPPEYSLRPPAAGASIPPEAEPARGGITAFGTTTGQDASAAERALVAAAGANAVNPNIRGQLDFEQTRTIRKSPTVADRVMFWRRDNPESIEAGAGDNATGGEAVTIERTGTAPRLRLPGT